MSEVGKVNFGKRIVIEIPEGQDFNKEFALTSMLRAFEWPYSETTHDSTEITPQAILAASETYYGSEVYGVLANDMLRYVREAAEGTVRGRTRRASSLEPDYSAQFNHNSFMHLPKVTIDAGTALSERPKKIRRDLADASKQRTPIALPFELLSSRTEPRRFSDGYESYEMGTLRPDKVTRQYLGEFLVSLDLDEHTHVGVLGKACDVLCEQAQLKELEPGAATVDEAEFIELDQLFESGREAGLSKDVLRHLKDKVRDNFYHTLASSLSGTSSYKPEREFEFEGEARLYLGFSHVAVQKIARSSIPDLAATYVSDTPAKTFLLDYVQ